MGTRDDIRPPANFPDGGRPSADPSDPGRRIPAIARTQRGGTTALSLLLGLASVGFIACAGRSSPTPEVGLLGMSGVPAARHPAPSAGLAPLRRLTREQYLNSAHDLLGASDVLPSDLPLDEGAGGFFSNIIAPVTDLHLEKY